MDCSGHLRLRFCLIVGLAVLANPSFGWAEESVTVVKTDEGKHYRLPPDWPIEERAGIRGPIPTEEYLYRKFSAIDQQLQSLEQRLSALDVRLRVLEEQAKVAKHLRSEEPKQTSR